MPRNISIYQQQIEEAKLRQRQERSAGGGGGRKKLSGFSAWNIIHQSGGSSSMSQPKIWGGTVSASSIDRNLGIMQGPDKTIGAISLDEYYARTSHINKGDAPLGHHSDPFPNLSPDTDDPNRKKKQNTAQTKREQRRQKKRRRWKRSNRRNRSRIPKPEKPITFGFGKINFLDDIGKINLSGRAKMGIGLGALALTAGAAKFATSTREGLSAGNPIAYGRGMKPEDVANSTFWQRQAAVAGAGYLNASQGGGMGPVGALGSYASGRFMDGWNVMFNSPLNEGGISPGFQIGAKVGGAMSVMAATAIKGFSKGGMRGGPKGLLGGVAAIIGAGVGGAAIGGYQGSKVDIGLSRAIQTARKNILGQGRRMSKRAHTMGRGYRMWASPRGRRKMGQPGHLGMDGSMAFAMHNARNRSTV